MRKLIVLSLLLVGCGSAETEEAALVAGVAGPTGATGEQGPAGLTAETIVRCEKLVGSLYVAYQATTFTNGDKWLACSLSGYTYQSHFGYFVRSTNVNASNERCAVTFDMDSASAGFWTFTRESGTRKAVYTDSGSAFDGYTVTFGNGDCVVE